LKIPTRQSHLIFYRISPRPNLFDFPSLRLAQGGRRSM
jgi:hypothetical protein